MGGCGVDGRDVYWVGGSLRDLTVAWDGSRRRVRNEMLLFFHFLKLSTGRNERVYISLSMSWGISLNLCAGYTLEEL